MAFVLKKKESVRKGIRRLGRRQVREALTALERCNRPDAVHEVRKRIKELRSLLRLVQPCLARSEYRRCSEPLRAAAGKLAAARDAWVTLNALDALQQHFQSEFAPGSFRKVRKILAKRCRENQAGVSRHGVEREVRRLLKSASAKFASLEIKDSGWSALKRGLETTYRAGRLGYGAVSWNGRGFHEWRKRVKDLYCHVGLLGPIWRGEMTALREELKELSDRLGDDHDLVLFTEPEMSRRFRETAPAELETLRALVQERREKLQAQALEIGARFYQETPPQFCKRLGRYWKHWRRKSRRGLNTSSL
ncbi:MAG: CHAD domain-containing protein [Verrucomicrobiota bacterium]